MLPKKRRIQRKEFTELLKAGRRYSSPHLSLFLLKKAVNEPSFDSKFAFSVSKKIAKKAVERNKWRRRGYSVIRSLISKVDSGYICLFSFKNDIRTLKYESLKEEVLKLLSDGGVII